LLNGTNFYQNDKGGRSMKKTVLFFMLFAALLGSFILPTQAQAVRHQWYCKHVKDHVQPPLDARLSFIEECNAYYIDRNHTDAKDKEKTGRPKTTW
jgi:hypothetical protein